MQFPTWPQDGRGGGSVEKPLIAIAARSEALHSGAHIYDAVVKWALYIAAFLVPVFFLPWTTSVLEGNKYLLIAIAAGVGVMAWLLDVVMSGRIRLRPTPPDIAVGGLLLATLIGTVFSMAVSRSLFGFSASVSSALVSVFALSFVYYLAAHTIKDRGAGLKKAFIAGTVIALAFTLLQIFAVYVLPFSFAHSRAFNSVGSINAVGVLAAIMLPLFLKSRLPVYGVKFLDVAKLGAILSVAFLVIMNWWVLWLVACIGMLAVIGLDSVAGALSSVRRWSMARFLIPMTIIVLGAFLLVIGFNFSFVRSNLPVEVAPSMRLSLSIAKNVLKTSTVTGYGPENFHLAFDRFGAKRLANTALFNFRFSDPISEAINRVVNEGIIGLLAIIGLVWVVARAFMRFKGAISGRDGAEHATGIFAAALAALGAFFFYPFNLTNAFAFYILLALLALSLPSPGERSVDIEDKPVFSLASSLGFIVGLIVVLTGWYFMGTMYAADAVFAKASAQSDAQAAADRMITAINLNAKNDSYYRAISQKTLSLLSSEIGNGSRSDSNYASRVQNHIQSAVDFARRATELNARESENWLNLGSVYQNLSMLVEDVEKPAEEAYRKAAELRPGDPTFANAIGTMYLNRSDLDRQLARSAGANAYQFNQDAGANLIKAEKAFKEAIDMSSNYGLAIYNLGAVYDRQGKISEATRQLEKIIPANADQPNLLFELGLLYYRANRKDDAAAALQRAITLSPQFANARWYLGLIYEERRNFAAALDEMNKVLETNKDNQTVLEKIEQLKAGKSSFPPQKVIDQKPL